ncbi:BTB/POZ domain-containing protein 3, partial [Stegodyphus mimosarum]
MDWRGRPTAICEVMRLALEKSILSDITFRVGSEAEEFKAHRLILALASPVFEAMFYGGLAEKGEKIDIPDISPEGFRCLLRYIYTANASFKNASDPFDTYIAADKYCIPCLKELSEHFASRSQITVKNVWIFLKHSLILDMNVVTERCLVYLKKCTDNALKDSSFLEASSEAIERILISDSLEAKELTLLKSIVRWAENQVSSSETASKKEYLDPLIRHIRFGVLDVESFCSFLDEESNILSDSDAIAIRKHLIDPQTCSLPDWCCSKKKRTTYVDQKPKTYLPSLASPKRRSNYRV